MVSAPVPCFFCGHDLAAHHHNEQGHVWRRGPRVEPEDFMRADEATQAIHRKFYDDQWRLRGVSSSPLQHTAEQSK